MGKLTVEDAWISAGCFLSSIAVAGLVLILSTSGWDVNLNTDYRAAYRPIAESLLAGNGLTTPRGDPATYYPPGYSLLIAGTLAAGRWAGIPEAVAILALQMLCLGTSSILLFLTARATFGRASSLLAPLAWVTCPLVLWLARQPSVEIPFMVVLSGSFCCLAWTLVPPARALVLSALAGVLVGAAMLIRSIALGLGFVLAVIIVMVRRKERLQTWMPLVTAMLLGNLVVVAPWEAWAWYRTGTWVLLSTGGPTSVLDGLTYAVNPDKTYRAPTGVPTDVSALMCEIQNRRDEARTPAGLTALLVDEMRLHPLASLKLAGLKTVRAWFATDSGRSQGAVMGLQVAYLLLIAASLRAARRLGGPPGDLATGVAFVMIYFWGMTALVLSIVRYMVPALALSFTLLPALISRPLPPTAPARNAGIPGRPASPW